MDRLTQLRGDAGGSRDVSLDASASDSFLTAADTPSKYYSLSEDDTFDIAKDVSLATATSQTALNEDCLISNLSPIGKKDICNYKIGKQIEAANILSGGVDIFDDTENSYDGNELVIDDNVELEDKSPSLKSPEGSDLPFHKGEDQLTESTLIEDMGGSKETEVVLQIDGKNVDAINIGNGLYLYRKQGQEELAAVQIIDDDQHQPSFKFLKVRENAEGNLEVYEEIEIEVPEEAPVKGKPAMQKTTHVPIKDINKVINDPGCSKLVEKKKCLPDKEDPIVTTKKIDKESVKDTTLTESKTELNLNGKMVKISESRKSPLMAYHSTPNKEGIPLTKTMVDQQLHPSRHSDNIKKTIEVHTDSGKQRLLETPTKSKEVTNSEKSPDIVFEVDKPVKATNSENVSQPNFEEIEKKAAVITDTNDDKINVLKETPDVEVKEPAVDGSTSLSADSKLSIDKQQEKDAKMLNKITSNIGKDTNTSSGLSDKCNKSITETSTTYYGTTRNVVDMNEKNTAKENLIMDRKSDVENSETLGLQEDTAPIELIESEEIEVDDNALIIEEVIETEPEVSELKEKNIQELTPTETETKKVQESEKIERPGPEILKEPAAKLEPFNSNNLSKDKTSTEVATKVTKVIENPKLIEDKKTNTENVLKTKVNDTKVLFTNVIEKVKEIESTSLQKYQNIEPDTDNKKTKSSEVRPDTVETSINLIEIKTDTGKTTVDLVDKNTAAKKICVESTALKIIDKETTSNLRVIPTIFKNTGADLLTQRTVTDKKSTESIALTAAVPKTTGTKTVTKETIVDSTAVKTVPKDTGIDLTGNKPILKTANVDFNAVKPMTLEPSTNLPLVNTAAIQKSVNPTVTKPTAIEAVIPEVRNKNADFIPKKLPLEGVPASSYKKESFTIENPKDVKTSATVNKQHIPATLPQSTQNIIKPDILKPDVKPLVKTTETKTEVNKPEPPKQSTIETKPKLINNNHAPVPFGKWTEANRQDFLNKIKESKVPVNSSNTSQLKQPNDLNRRDVLKKIDSQRQTYNASVKVQESLQKSNPKTETAFASKTVTKRESKVPVKSEVPIVKPKPVLIKKPVQESIQREQPEPSSTVSSTKQETQRKEINNQDLIDKTIEGIINRTVTGKSPEDKNQTVTATDHPETEQQTIDQPTLLDAIEMKMNELHGIPFVERPPHELPRPYTADPKVAPKTETLNPLQKGSKIPNLLPLTKSQQKLKDCEDDILNYESIQEKTVVSSNVSSKSAEKPLTDLLVTKPEASINTATKDKIITETEFDKFARRNSVTYEDCLTVTDAHQVIQAVIPRDLPPKKISRNEQMLAEAKAKSPHKHPVVRQYPSKGASKYVPTVDPQNKQFHHSKLQMAYQTALTVKRHLDSPITIIEDKPVKVVYLDSSSEFTSVHLNVQGRDLSPAKRAPEADAVTVGTCDSLDSDILDAIDDVKSQDETKTKSKHQRKQVLTPVETPDLELIEPGDLGIEVSPKKKRKTEDKPEKSLKSLVPKKSYLLGRSTPRAETLSQPSPVVAPVHSDPVSAIDNLVKAAELLENQSENISASTSVQNVDSPQSTPVKRGRGRPRKNPLPDGSPATDANKESSPQKKPRLIDAKPTRRVSSSDDDSSDDDSMIKENWTMGKINENIVCPICNKLFRSENVVFKHVKHCTGPSPSRSDADKRSPRRSRLSRESEGKSRGSRQDENEDVDLSPVRSSPMKRKSKDSTSKSTSSIDDVIPMETDSKEWEAKKESRKSTKSKLIPRTNLVCEICGKSFRQLSYLVNHKLQHNKDEPKKPASEGQPADKTVFSCETCKKEFRKLHHLVQHRLIHNPVPARSLRKSSSEQKEVLKSQEVKVEDQSAGFRCEPCDKSFRKLHHLVEHRETHDGINRQRSNSVTQVNPEKPTPPPQCDICKKTFRKLHHLVEHKEQHLETCSEKSDDQKSIKSSLSTKDIIHECNLCYMVFPNEHSLNKHTVICLRKKKQSAAKNAAKPEDTSGENVVNASDAAESKVEIVDVPKPMNTDVAEEVTETPPEKASIPPAVIDIPQVKEDLPKNETVHVLDKKQIDEPKEKIPENKNPALPETPAPEVTKKTVEASTKIKQIDEVIVIEDTPKKKIPVKDKVTPSVTKRQKTAAPAAPVEDVAPAATSSDDDEIRYMFNPDFQVEETVEGKNFIKVRAKKRSSLQIERPNSKDLPRRNSSLQHPPKIPRLRAKSDDTKVALPKPPLPKTVKTKLVKIGKVPSTDSDDSDVKYSFPKTVPAKPKPAVKQEAAVDNEKTRRKTMVDKRKSLGGIAKRKSLGKAIAKPKPTPAKPVKRRTMAAEHRCDCGQLFSSAALLARHASLAHTPPRVRRRRASSGPAPKPTPNEKNKKPTEKPKPSPRVVKDTKPVRKSSAKSDKDARKSVVPESVKKSARNAAHGGVPVPEKRASRK